VGSTATTPSADARADRKELARIERQLAKLDTANERLHQQLADNASDHERVMALDGELRALATERTDLEERWLQLSEATD
jgi:ATP-binding cassette subfamily F protein uup